VHGTATRIPHRLDIRAFSSFFRLASLLPGSNHFLTRAMCFPAPAPEKKVRGIRNL
jgi:hypothetical protein